MSGSRIHFVVPGSIERLSGGTIYDARIIRELRRLGFEVVVHELAGRFPWPDGAATAAAARAIAAVRPGEAAVVDGLALAALGPARPEEASIRVVPLVHMPLREERGLPARLRRALGAAEDARLARADTIVCTSSYTAADLARRGADARSIAVVEPGTDPAGAAREGHRVHPLDAAPDRARGRSGEDAADRGGVRLLAVGAVTRLKGHRYLVRALAGLRRLPWRLDIVGSTTAEPGTVRALAAEIERRGLARRVRLRGELPRHAVRAAYRRADVFVLPSLFESYGMALAEAAVHGVPLVAARAGAVPTTPAGGAARLVPPADADALARALEPLVRDPAARAELAAAARAAARRLPSWTTAGRRFAAAAARGAEGAAGGA